MPFLTILKSFQTAVKNFLSAVKAHLFDFFHLQSHPARCASVWEQSSMARAADCSPAGPRFESLLAVLLSYYPTFINHLACCDSVWVHSSVVRAADCRSAGPWCKSGCALRRFPMNIPGIGHCQQWSHPSNSSLFSNKQCHWAMDLCSAGCLV